jgi:hypothetical protein
MCDPFRYPWEESKAKVRIWKWSTVLKNSQFGLEILRTSPKWRMPEVFFYIFCGLSMCLSLFCLCRPFMTVECLDSNPESLL